MYNEMTTTDLIATAHQAAHPNDNPSAEHALLIDELSSRLTRLSVWRERMTEALNPHLREDDGTDLTPDHVRVSNMLERISSPSAAKAVVTGGGGKSDGKDSSSPQVSAPETDAIMAEPDRGSGWLVAGKLEKLARRLEPHLARSLSQLEQANNERDEARRDLTDAREVLSKAARFVEAYDPQSRGAEASRRETLESVNSLLNPVKKTSLGNVVPDPKNDPTFSAEGNPPSERFPKGLSRQSKGTSPTPSDGRGHGVTP